MLMNGRPDELLACLTTLPPFDWDQPPGRVRLYRWMDGNEELDQVMIHRYPLARESHAVEISAHGGPRIVQRMLMQLRQRGVSVVPAAELLHTVWPEAAGLEAEALALLPKAQTRKMAAWLVSNARLLTEEIERLQKQGIADQWASVRHGLSTLLERGMPGLSVLDGIRVVLIAEPNAGKSTLANALSEQERAIVSDQPGTTRDWTEQFMAIEGIPFTVVDTAGIRNTADAIERLAIEATHAQWASADLVVQVIDAMAAPTPAEIASLDNAAAQSIGRCPSPDLFVWNKCDAPMHPGQRKLQERLKSRALRISARRGDGLETMRSMILEKSGYMNWPGGNPELFTERQRHVCHAIVSEESSRRPAIALAALADLLKFPTEDTQTHGYNPM